MKLRLIITILPMLAVVYSSGYAVTIRDVVYTPKNSGKVVFSHRDHLNEQAMSKNCRACHDKLYNLKNKKRFTMADMAAGRSCGACHTGVKAFSLSACVRCHRTKELVFQVKAVGPVAFSHTSHNAAAADCGICHPALFATKYPKRFTMADMEKGKSCGACHEGKKAFSVAACVSCHPVKEITYQVPETGPTLFSHARHLAVTQCRACHPKLYAPNLKNRRVGMKAMEKGESCGACHNTKNAFSVAECSRCHPVRELLFEEKSTGNVVFSHAFHAGTSTCRDCHTSLFTTSRSPVKISMGEMERGKSCGGCHDGKGAFSVTEKCEACHKM